MEKATFGGGCFWCTEAVFGRLKGVVRVTPGYTGGSTPDPHYEEVCTGRTGHAEAVEIEYDPQQIDFETLLNIFWATHDPTSLNKQGEDRGTQYRSALFYHNPQQKRTALEAIKKLETEKVFDSPIVTSLESAGEFYPAEEYHRNYYTRNYNAPYCLAVINPKLVKMRQKFAYLMKP